MKQFIRKVSAVGASVAMLGMTVGGAVADLSELPAPFVEGGSYVSTALVTGSPADAAAGTTLQSYFDGFVSADTTLGEVSSSSDTEKIYIYEDIKDEFSANLDDGNIDDLWDNSINFKGESYETHEQVFASSDVILATSVSDGEEELGMDVALFTNATNTWGYQYVFDETFTNPVSSDDELEIVFLGKPIRISSTTVSTNTISITTGTDIALGQGGATSVGGHTVNVGTIFESEVEISVNNGDSEFMSEDDVETFDIGTDQVEVKVRDIGYTDDVESRTVLLTVGEDIVTTVKNGDPVQTELGELDYDDDAGDAPWNWNISLAGGSNDNFTSGNYIGIKYRQKIDKNDDDPSPVMNSGSYSSPLGYVSLDFDLVEPNYNKYTVEFVENYDVNGTVEEDVILFTAADTLAENEGFIFNGTDTARVACNATAVCWYENDDGDFARTEHTSSEATILNTTGTGGLRIESGTGTDKYIVAMNGTAGGGASGGNQFYMPGMNAQNYISQILIEDRENSDDGADWRGDWYFNVSIGNQRLGSTVDDADAADLVYNSSSAGIGTRFLGTWDDDDGTYAGSARGLYGTYFVNIEGNADNNELEFYVPEDEVYADVKFSARGAGATTTNEPALVDAGDDLSAYSNLLLVGGPCVNSATAEWLGVPAGSCGTDSGIGMNSGLIRLMESAGKTALIVAGWETEDTQRAASSVSSDLLGDELLV